MRAALAFLFVLLAVRPTPAAGFQENFSGNPAASGWRIFGDPNLFQWDATNQNLRVTWDSAQTNSYFHHPLGTILARDDTFSLAFDVRLDDIGVGTQTNKPFPMPIAVGFLNLGNATRTNFIRGTGTGSPNLVEFSYFWDAGFGPTVWPICISSNSSFNFNGASDYLILELTPGDTYHVEMTFAAGTLATALTNLTTLAGATVTSTLGGGFTDFRLDTIAVSSYSDTSTPDSVLAHGTVDNLSIVLPPPPVQDLRGAFAGNQWQAPFTARTNWLYTLERTEDFQSWTAASPATPGVNGTLTLTDTNAPGGKMFYRVRAERP